MEKQSKSDYSLLDIAKGKGIQKEYELYQSNIGKEVLLLLMNLCVIAALVALECFWAKATADNAFLEWLFNFDHAGRRIPLLFVIYLFVFVFWLFPKLEIKMADKYYLWVKDSQVYIETPKHTTVYASSDIRKIVLHYRSSYLRKIVIHTTNGENTVFCRPLTLIPYSKLKAECNRNITGFSTELITHLKMYSEFQKDMKKNYRKVYSKREAKDENDRLDTAIGKNDRINIGADKQLVKDINVSTTTYKADSIDTTTEYIPQRRFWKDFISGLGFAFFAYLFLLFGIQESALMVKVFFLFFGAFFALLSMAGLYMAIFYKVPYKLSTDGIFIRRIGLVPWSSIVSVQYIDSVSRGWHYIYSVHLEFGDLSFLRKSTASERRKSRR